MNTEKKITEHQIKIEHIEKTQERFSYEFKNSVNELKEMISQQIKKQDENQEKIFSLISMSKNMDKMEQEVKELKTKVDKSLVNSEINKSKFTTIYRGIAIFLTGASVAIAIMKIYQS